MKKCPYCHTFMNDDINQCPNCLKDMSNLRSMPDVSTFSKSKSLNMIIYGVIMLVGGALASISQYGLIEGYQTKYDKIYAQMLLISNLESEQYKTLLKEATEYANLINDCELRTILFMILAAIGLGVIVATLVITIIKKIKRKGK